MKVQTIMVWHLALLVTAEWQLEQFKVADLKMEEHLKCLKHEEDKDIKQPGDKCIFIFYIQPLTVTRFQQVSGHIPTCLYYDYLHGFRMWFTANTFQSRVIFLKVGKQKISFCETNQLSV